MAIIRKEHVNRFTTVDNGFIRDSSLSLKAKGLMLTFLSLPDDWEFTERWLRTQCSDGETSVSSAINELIEAGYLTRERERKTDGTMGSMIYTIFETPRSQEPIRENPVRETAPQLNTNNTLNNTVSNIPNTESTKYIYSSDSEKHDIERIVSFLNRSTHQRYSPKSQSTISHIRARFREGFTPDDFRRVIDAMTDAWIDDPKMRVYLRPSTLFGTKFESYLNQALLAEGEDDDS